ncbi:unnamed protein product [Boreogadus saida]
MAEEGLLSRHLFFSPSVDLAEAIDIFRAGVPDAQDADDEHFEVDDVASLDDVFAGSASEFSRSGASTEATVVRGRNHAGWPISSARSWPDGCRVAAGRRVYISSGSPASKKRRPFQLRGRTGDSLHEPVDTDACTSFLVSHIIPCTSLLQSVEGLMAAAHPVVPLGLLFMRRLQRWFARQRFDPVRHKLRVLLLPRSVSPDLEYWGNPPALLRGVPLGRVTSYVVVFTVVLCQPSGSFPIGGGCVGSHTLAAGSLVCVSSAQADPSSSGTGQTGEIIPDCSGSGEPLSSVVSRAGGALTDGAVAGTVQTGCAFTGPWDGAPPARCIGTAVGLAPERLILQGKAYARQGLAPPLGVKAHSTRGVAASTWPLYSEAFRWKPFARLCLGLPPAPLSVFTG